MDFRFTAFWEVRRKASYRPANNVRELTRNYAAIPSSRMGRHEQARYAQRPKNAVRPEKRIVDSGGVRLVVRDSGGRRKPVVLVHGLGLARHTWRRVAPVLSARGLRVVAYDQRGHGASGTSR